MNAVFLLHDDELALLKADWVAARYPLAGYVVVAETRPPLLPYLLKRVRRLGFWKVFDELLWRAWYAIVHRRHDNKVIASLTRTLREGIPLTFSRPKVHRVNDANSDAMVDLLRGLNAEVGVATLNVLLRSSVFSVPTHGILIYHPGITPEYRGVHAAFWATLKGDFGKIGWSLLQVDAGIDTGKVLAQGIVHDIDPVFETHVVMQHKAHAAGLPGIVEVLRSMESGVVPRVDIEGRPSHYFTHPGLTDYVKMRRSLRRNAARVPSVNSTLPRGSE